MKIGYFADGIWSHKAIEQITKNPKFEIKFIVPRYNKRDKILKKWSEKLKIDFLILKNINSSSSIKILKKYNIDLIVSMSFDQIFKKEILNLPKLGAINCHAGALPFYRGRNVLNWVLINDEKYFGVTVHYVDEGIDTGDIILQKLTRIYNKDDYSTILNKASKICANLLYASLLLVLNRKINTIKQIDIDKEGSYCRKRVLGDENINWNWNSRQIFNFVRAITSPGPCARAFIRGSEILIKKVKIIKSTDSNNYKIREIIIKKKKIFVKTNDGIIQIESYKDENNIIFNKGNFFDK